MGKTLTIDTAMTGHGARPQYSATVRDWQGKEVARADHVGITELRAFMKAYMWFFNGYRRA